MKNGERRATLTAMSRTIVELDTDLELKRRENADLKDESMKVGHFETVVKELKAKVTQGNDWRSEMQRDIVHLKNKINASDEMVIDRQLQINSLQKTIDGGKQHEAALTGSLLRMEKDRNLFSQKLAEREALKPAAPIIIESATVHYGKSVDEMKAVMTKILKLCECYELASLRRIEKIIPICEEALK